jgi:hypothetical protein
MNRWGIPDEIEKIVIKRDLRCVYCGISFRTKKAQQRCKGSPSWEHVINDISVIALDNIVRCCISCNASKGKKNLLDWFATPYCLKRKINEKTVARIVRIHIKRYCESG